MRTLNHPGIVLVSIMLLVFTCGLANVDQWLMDLNNPNIFIRQSAVQNLAESNSTKASDSLIVALNDNDSQVREATVEALGWKLALGEGNDTKIIGNLLIALNDTDGRVREAATLALGVSNDTWTSDLQIQPPTDPTISMPMSPESDGPRDCEESLNALRNEHSDLADELNQTTTKIRTCLATNSEAAIEAGVCDHWESAADGIREEQRDIFRNFMRLREDCNN